jgi:hypothetical protein
MTPGERKRRQRQREQAASEPMRFVSEEWRDFTSLNGLERKVGAVWHELPALVLR